MCNHKVLYKGTHESFAQGWLCEDCGQLVPSAQVAEILRDYAVVLMAIRLDSIPKRKRT